MGHRRQRYADHQDDQETYSQDETDQGQEAGNVSSTAQNRRVKDRPDAQRNSRSGDVTIQIRCVSPAERSDVLRLGQAHPHVGGRLPNQGER
jgi:hypothetical protein